MLCLWLVLVSPGAYHWTLVYLVQCRSIGPGEIPEEAQSLAFAITYQILCHPSCLKPMLTSAHPLRPWVSVFSNTPAYPGHVLGMWVPKEEQRWGKVHEIMGKGWREPHTPKKNSIWNLPGQNLDVDNATCSAYLTRRWAPVYALESEGYYWISGKWLREGEWGGSLLEISSHGTIILLLSGNSLERKGHRTKELASYFWEKQKRKTKSKQGLLEVGKSVALIPLPTFLYRTTCNISTLPWLEESFGGLVLKTELREVFLNLGYTLAIEL